MNKLPKIEEVGAIKEKCVCRIYCMKLKITGKYEALALSAVLSYIACQAQSLNEFAATYRKKIHLSL